MHSLLRSPLNLAFRTALVALLTVIPGLSETAATAQPPPVPLLPSEGQASSITVERLRWRGTVVFDPRRVNASVRPLERMLGELQAEGDRVVEGIFLSVLAELAQTEGYLDISRDYYEQALEAFEAAGETQQQSAVWLEIGTLHRNLGNLDAALTAYEQVLALPISSDTVTGLRLIGSLQAQMGQDADAIETYQRAIALAQEQGFVIQHAIALDQLGSLQQASGNSAAALASYQRALAVLEGRAEDVVMLPRIRILNNLASLYRSQQQGDLAESTHQEALALLQGGELYQLVLLQALGRQYLEAGQLSQAETYYQQSVALLENSADPGLLINALKAAQLDYQRQGQLRSALDYALRHLAIQESRIRDAGGIAVAQENLGQLHCRLGQWSEAIAAYEAALSFYRSEEEMIGDVAYTLESMGYCYTAQGEPDRALAVFEEALSLYRSLSFAAGEADVLEAIARIHEAQGKSTPAELYQDQAEQAHANAEQLLSNGME